MAKRKNLNAYVRYDGSNKLIPGSLIFRQKKPYGKFKEMIDPSLDICCGPSLGCGTAGYWYEGTVTQGETFAFNPGAGVSVTDGSCNVYKLTSLSGAFGEGFFYYNPLIEKFDGAGNLLWQKVFYSLDVDTPVTTDRAASMKLGVDNSLYILTNFVIIKLDLDGNVIWEKSYFDSAIIFTFFVDIVTHPSGRVYLLHQLSEGTDPVNWYNVVSEIDPTNGNILNTNQVSMDTLGLVSPPDTYYGYLATYDNEGNIVTTINAYNSVDVDNYVCAVYKLDAELNLIWFKLFTPPGGFGVYIDSEPTSLEIDSQNNIIVGMWWASAIMKLDSSGNILWQTFIGSAGFEQEQFDVFGAVVDEGDNVYVITRTSINKLPDIVFPPDVGNIYIMNKFNSAGVAQFSYAIAEPNNFWNFWAAFNCSRTTTYSNGTILATFFSNGETNVIKLPLTDLSGTTSAGLTFINVFPSMVFTPSTFTTDDYTPITNTLSLPTGVLTIVEIDPMLITITDPITV